MADGFALAVYDVQALSKGIRAEADAIGEHVRVVRSSGVDRADFGDSGDAVGAAYVRTVHSTLAGSLDAFRSASEDLASGSPRSPGAMSPLRMATGAGCSTWIERSDERDGLPRQAGCAGRDLG